MKSDGQLYNVLHKGEREQCTHAPPCGPIQPVPPCKPMPAPCHDKRKKALHGFGTDEILLLGIIFLLLSDENGTDLPLLLALLYVLLSK